MNEQKKNVIFQCNLWKIGTRHTHLSKVPWNLKFKKTENIFFHLKINIFRRVFKKNLLKKFKHTAFNKNFQKENFQDSFKFMKKVISKLNDFFVKKIFNVKFLGKFPYKKNSENFYENFRRKFYHVFMKKVPEFFFS